MHYLDKQLLLEHMYQYLSWYGRLASQLWHQTVQRKFSSRETYSTFSKQRLIPANPTQLFDTYLFEWWMLAGPPGFISGDEIEQAYAFHITKVILNSYDNCCGSLFSSMGTDYVYLQITQISLPLWLFHPRIHVPPQPVGLSFSVHWMQQHIFSGN